MSSPYQLLFRISFEHMFFADGVLRALRIVPAPACQDMLRRARVLLREQEDGVAAFGDAGAVARLRLHMQEAGGALNMLFQVFAVDPHFFEYTLPAWPSGKVLFLDTASAVPDAAGRRMLHATPYVPATALVERDAPGLAQPQGQPGALPAMLLQVAVTPALVDAAEVSQRHFHARFDAASSYWKYCLFGAVETPVSIVDLAGEVEFEHVDGVEIAGGRRAAVFLSRRQLPMRERSEARFQLRAAGAAGDKVLIKRMPNASVGKRFRDIKDGNEILVSEIFINH